MNPPFPRDAASIATPTHVLDVETTKVEAAAIADHIGLFADPDDVVELCALNVEQATFSGFFDHEHLNDMGETALELSGKASGVYALMPINANATNRVSKAKKGSRANDVTVGRLDVSA